MRRITYEDKLGNPVIGWFHGFSQSFIEFENGPGNFPVAIVERDDGVVEIIDAANVTLLDIHLREQNT